MINNRKSNDVVVSRGSRDFDTSSVSRCYEYISSHPTRVVSAKRPTGPTHGKHSIAPVNADAAAAVAVRPARTIQTAPPYARAERQFRMIYILRIFPIGPVTYGLDQYI